MQKYGKHEKLKQYVFPKLTTLSVMASNVSKLSEVLGKEFKRMILSVFRKNQRIQITCRVTREHTMTTKIKPDEIKNFLPNMKVEFNEEI